MTAYVTLADDMNIRDDRAKELIEKYLNPIFSQWVSGQTQLRTGQIFRMFVERGELLSNESAYLISIFSEQVAYMSLRENVIRHDAESINTKLSLPDNFKIRFKTGYGEQNAADQRT